MRYKYRYFTIFCIKLLCGLIEISSRKKLEGQEQSRPLHIFSFRQLLVCLEPFIVLASIFRYNLTPAGVVPLLNNVIKLVDAHIRHDYLG